MGNIRVYKYEYEDMIELTFKVGAFPLLEDFAQVLKEAAGTFLLENDDVLNAFEALKTCIEINKAIEEATKQIAEDEENEREILNIPFEDDEKNVKKDDPQEDDRK